MSMSPALSPRGPEGPGGLPSSTHLHHPHQAPYSPHSQSVTPTPLLQTYEPYTQMTEGYYKEIYPGVTNKPKYDDDIENVLNQVRIQI